MKKLMTSMIGVVALMAMNGCSTSRYYHLPTLEFDEIDYGFPVSKVAVRNVHIACIDQGRSDEVLLLIHGLGSYAKGWIRNIPAWAEDYRVIAVDLLGYSKSDKGYYDFTLSFHSQVLFEMLDELGIAEVTVVGHSMGGQIAMIMALERPERVKRLVLISPAGFERFEKGEGQWMYKAVTPEFVKDTPIRSIATNLKSNFYNTPDEAEFMTTERIQIRGAHDFDLYCYAVSKNVEAMIEEPVWDKLDQIHQPTLIIFGERDGLIPNPFLHGGKTINVARIGEEAIPNSRLIMMPDCGHFVHFEKPGETNRAVLSFMEE